MKLDLGLYLTFLNKSLPLPPPPNTAVLATMELFYQQLIELNENSNTKINLNEERIAICHKVIKTEGAINHPE